MPRVYTIRELAEEFEVSHKTLRFYEKHGLLSPVRGKRNMRLYSRGDRRRLIGVLRGTGIGYTLNEIGGFFRLLDVEPGQDPARASDKIDQAIDELLKKQARLDATLRYLKDLRPKLVRHIERTRGKKKT